MIQESRALTRMLINGQVPSGKGGFLAPAVQLVQFVQLT